MYVPVGIVIIILGQGLLSGLLRERRRLRSTHVMKKIIVAQVYVH